jgi:hypothetical protein
MQSTRYPCQILTKLEFSRQIFEKFLNMNFMKICPVGAKLLNGDGRTVDLMELIIAFRSFAKAPKNQHYKRQIL